MHRLTEIELNFNCRTLARAQWFNGSAEQLWQHELLPVAQQVLDEFDVAAEVQLDEICLQLPPLCLPADRYLLQHSFRQALRTQLWLLLPQATTQTSRQQQHLSAAQRISLISALKSADTAALTLHWPLYRRFAAELVALLRQLAASGDICTVLAFGLSNEMLGELVLLLAPAEQRFVLQLMAQPQLFAVTPARLSGVARQQARLPAPALRKRQRHLWQLSLSYLLVERGSRFNRQSYLHYLLQRMAAHDNVSLQALVQHMLQTLTESQRYFAAQSPLLLQLTELLQPLLPSVSPDNTTPVSGKARYFSQRLTQTAAQLPAVARCSIAASAEQTAASGSKAQLSPGRHWQQWLLLLRQQRLTLAQQRRFNVLLQQLLQQNSSLWLDPLRRQLQLHSLLPSLVQHAQPELLLRLFQQLQPASVAAMTPYIRILHWALAALSLPLPLQHHASWQPLLQSALQRQPLTLNVLLAQLQLWLQAKQGGLAARQTLQQLAGQLQHYSGAEDFADASSAGGRQRPVARLWQQLQWQLAVTAPWATKVQPLLASGLSRMKPSAAPPLWQQLVQLLLQALPAAIQQQALQLCQQVAAQHSGVRLSSPLSVAVPQAAIAKVAIAQQQNGYRQPDTTAANGSATALLSSTLLSTLAASLAPACTVAFYRKLQSRLEQTRPAIARNVLLRQLQRLIHYEAPPAAVVAAAPQQAGLAQQVAMRQPGVVAAQSLQVVMNAGLVLAAPYLPLLWQRLGWLDAQHFNSARHAWQACALLHYMATGEANAQIEADYWQQWRLGMLLTGRQPPCPVDMDISLSTTQRELADSLLAGILAQWPKLAHSSAETLRECFLQRSGSLCQLGNGSGWQLQLDSGPYDMLLDGLPWSFSLICYPWMRGELYVHWRG